MTYEILVTEHAKAELLPMQPIGEPGPEEVTAETLFSLISPGTELASAYLGQAPFPKGVGYSNIGRVLKIGDAIKNLRAGDLIFYMGGHRVHGNINEKGIVPLPQGMESSEGTIARLMGVSMTTLITTCARPGDSVLVMGAGPVGYLAAHVFRTAGYEITVCDPDEERLEVIRASGIKNVSRSVTSGSGGGLNGFALVLECSGHEGALLDALKSVRMRGEVVMVGVPWKKRTDHTAHEIAWEVFHKYAVLRSGWEWELPFSSDPQRPHSIISNLTTALNWLKEGRIPLDNAVRIVSPRDCQEVYKSLVERKWKELFIIFDWSQV